MKKITLIMLCCMLFIGFATEAQIAYSDNFDGSLTTASNDAYDVSLDSGNLLIDGNGTAGAYNALQYDVHDNGTLTTFDMSAAPQIFIRARGTGAPALRIDVKDAAEYVSNLSANAVTLSDEFVTYELDYTGDFFDGGFGGSACDSADAPCPVDPATIANLIIFVNDATGGYDGLIEIDWISVGEPLEEEEEESNLIYSDDFNDNLTTESTSAYTNTLVDGNLNIVGNGTAGAFSAFAYNVHDMGTETSIDVSANPVMYIRAKATNSPELRIDLRDAAGYVTNLQANAVTIGEDYTTYTLDFTGDFLDGGFGGSPCESADAPCPVDATEITQFVFFVNAATGGYEGVIDIDWISIGEPLVDESALLYSDQFEDNLTTESTSAYTTSLVDGNLNIDGNGTAGAFAAFAYQIHDMGELTSIDVSSNPVMYVKVRGTDNPELRIDMRDEAGYVTNLQANAVTISDAFVIYSLDFTGDFLDGGYGGSPCEAADAPCPVDPTTINQFVFFVNAADGGYDGLIEIDWISIGEPLETLPPALVYSDEFDDFLTTESNSAYTSTLVEGNLNIVGNGTAGAYQAIAYDVHDMGTLTTIDISANPKMYLKAKGTNNPTLRIDLRDEAGYITNLQAHYIGLSNDYGLFELDFTGDFLDGGYGGSPCDAADAPCPVDPTTISKFVFYVNDATGGYEGAIDIDWISIGEPLETSLPRGPQIRYNQLAYHSNREKLINITGDDDFAPIAYTVTDEAGDTLLTGTTGANEIWSESGEYVTTIDVSEIATPGTYTLVTDAGEIQFTVTDSGYEELSAAAFKYYYFNRASTEITAEFGGPWARNFGHPDTEIIVHPSAASDTRPAGTIISAPKGWYDAGDYNKYIVNSGISTYTLLATYEHFKSYVTETAYDIPENDNAIPDLLDEVKWNLDWMLAMQDPADGGVYHKLTGLNFSGRIMPDEYTFDRYVVQKTTAAALNFAAVTAVAARLYSDYEDQLPEYSALLLEASEKAYNWALNNPTVYYQQPDDVFTGEYGDNNVTDEFQWAAVELFITTGEQSYNDDIDIDAIGNGIPFWGYTAPLALISIAANAETIGDALDVDAANAKLLETADQLKSKVNESAMRVAMGPGDYNWGSNGQASNQLMLLLMAYQINEDESYLEAAFTGSDYILGRNATGYSFVSGFGDNPMMNPHHRISDADGVAEPVPGMVAGGPHSGQQDGCPGYPSTAQARSYQDTWCSYSTNEVTINWNAPLYYSFTALHIFQNGFNLSVDDVHNSDTSNKLVLYPNPTEQVLNIEVQNRNDLQVTVYALDGKTLLEDTLSNGNTALDVSALANGLYIVKVKAGTTTYAKQFVKQ